MLIVQFRTKKFVRVIFRFSRSDCAGSFFAPPQKNKSIIRKFIDFQWLSGKILGINYALLPNRQWNQKQKHKKQPWSNVECFAFGVGIVRFASLETRFHSANHTIPTPPSHEVSPHCPKDKNRSPFHGEKPLMIK